MYITLILLFIFLLSTLLPFSWEGWLSSTRSVHYTPNGLLGELQILVKELHELFQSSPPMILSKFHEILPQVILHFGSSMAMELFL
jgi:hypothetical protein